MKKWVMSLGGSKIAPAIGKIDHKFIKEFVTLIKSHSKDKFVVVTGGGSTARKYIQALRNLGASNKKQAKAGISITRFHASFLSRIFGKKANPPDKNPESIEKIENLLNKNQIVFTGALRLEAKKTSDGTAADIAAQLKCPFINITNIKGLYTKNPKENKDAKFIARISWKKFKTMANKIKFKAGQHFVLDQDAANTILENKIPTYIVGTLDDVDKILSSKKTFKGTLIRG